MSAKKWILSGIILSLVVGSLIYFGQQHHSICPSCLLKKLNPEVIKHYIESFGPWAIVVYIALYTANTMTLIPPIAFMSLSAGALFGPIWGTVALAAGAFCGTTATFIVSRFLVVSSSINLLKVKLPILMINKS